MATQFLGEIRMFGGNFAPAGWAFCNGQLIAISQNEALFALVGTIYGGDGISTFALPNLQGRTPIHQGTGPGLPTYVQGQVGGSETVTLLTSQVPLHSHSLQAVATPGHVSDPNGAHIAADRDFGAFNAGSDGTATQMSASAVSPSNGSGLPHDNLPPYLCVSFIIAIEGVFPSRN